MSVGAARDIGCRTVQAQQNLAVSVGARDGADEFAGDVARVEVGKDQHVGMARHLAVRQFAGGNLR